MKQSVFDGAGMFFIPEIACAVGANEAIVLQHIHGEIEGFREFYNDPDGVYWMDGNPTDLHEAFPWWSYITIRRAFCKLESMGILSSKTNEAMPLDRTKMYTINYAQLHDVLAAHEKRKSIDAEAEQGEPF